MMFFGLGVATSSCDLQFRVTNLDGVALVNKLSIRSQTVFGKTTQIIQYASGLHIQKRSFGASYYTFIEIVCQIGTILKVPTVYVIYDKMQVSRSYTREVFNRTKAYHTSLRVIIRYVSMLWFRSRSRQIPDGECSYN